MARINYRLKHKGIRLISAYGLCGMGKFIRLLLRYKKVAPPNLTICSIVSNGNALHLKYTKIELSDEYIVF